MNLSPDDVEAIARRVAELVGAPADAACRYVDAAALARTLAVEREWIYAHAQELGAIRLGGPQGRLRFDLEHVREVLARGQSAPGPRALRAGARARHRGRHPSLDRRARSS